MSDSQPILALVEAHLSESAESKSSNTIRAYKGDLTRFVDFLTTKTKRKCNSVTDLRSIDDDDIAEYMKCIYRKNKNSTAARALAAISEWFKFLGRKGHVSHNPASAVERPSIPERLPRIPSVDKLNNFCDSVSDDNSNWPARDSAMIEILYGCGVLVSQLVELDVENVDLDSRIIHVSGSHGRNAPLGDYAAEALRKYLAERTARLKDHGGVKLLSTGPLFLNMSLRGLGKPAVQARLTTRSVGRIVKNIAVKCGLNRLVHPQTLRFAYGAHMLDGGAELRHVQDLLGHLSVASTLRVKKLAKARLKAVVDRTHPRARSMHLDLPRTLSGGQN